MDWTHYQLIVSISLFALGIWQLMRGMLAKRRCTQITSGSIFRVESVAKSRSRRSGGSTKYTSYTPYYQFEANGQPVEIRGKWSKGEGVFTEGETVEIRYNPDKPEEYHCAKDGWHGTGGIFSIVAGLVFLVNYLLF